MSRGSGRTTKQMQDAAPRSVYIVAGNKNWYRELAKKHGREDLYILDLSNLREKDYYRYAGLALGSVILDHDVIEYSCITESEQRGLEYLQCLVRSPK